MFPRKVCTSVFTLENRAPEGIEKKLHISVPIKVLHNKVLIDNAN